MEYVYVLHFESFSNHLFPEFMHLVKFVISSNYLTLGTYGSNHAKFKLMLYYPML